MVHLTEVQTLAISSGERIFAKPKEAGVKYHLLLQNSVLNPDVGIYTHAWCAWVYFDTKLGVKNKSMWL